MAILFAGGEDIDFQAGTAATVTTTAGTFRSGYSRCAVYLATTGLSFIKSRAFTPQTSLWVSAWLVGGGNFPSASNVRFFGLCRSGSDKGVYIGSTSGVAAKVTLYKWDGTTATLLQSEGGTSLPSGSTGFRIDMQVANYGAAATIKVYLNGTQIISFTGDASLSGITDLDTVCIGWTNGAITTFTQTSEVIVADEDTRAFSLVTLLPNALGTTDQWTGTFTDINEAALSDATVNTTNVVAQLQQYALSDLPSGNFAVKAVTISARATAPAGSTSNSVQLGVQTGTGTDVGTAQAPGTGLVTLTRIMATDPTTASQWTPTVVNGMQLVMKSGA